MGNRIAFTPWKAGTDRERRPSELTVRRWQRFGSSGAKLIWAGEAWPYARHEGRANPHQIIAAEHTPAWPGSAAQRPHRGALHVLQGSDRGLLIGMQLTHSGRFCRPNLFINRPEPRILYHHPVLDRRMGLPPDFPLLTDGDIRSIIDDYHRAAQMAWDLISST